jgi:hypothetical protein
MDIINRVVEELNRRGIPGMMVSFEHPGYARIAVERANDVVFCAGNANHNWNVDVESVDGSENFNLFDTFIPRDCEDVSRICDVVVEIVEREIPNWTEDPEEDEDDEESMLDLLTEAIEDSDDIETRRIETFQENGLLTRDKGLVLKMRDGSEYQITVKQSRGPRR